MTCGHTHLALTSEHDGVLYVNSGTWTEAPPCPFLVVQGNQVRLKHWPLPEVGTGDGPLEAVVPANEHQPAVPPLPTAG